MTLTEQLNGQRRSTKKSKGKTQPQANTMLGNTRTKAEQQQKKGKKQSAGAAGGTGKDAKGGRDGASASARDNTAGPSAARDSSAAAARDNSAAAAQASREGGLQRDRGLRGSFRALRRSTEDLSASAATAIKKTIGSFVRSSPLRRSFSFGKDLNKAGSLRKNAWSASLQSLQEDVPEEEVESDARRPDPDKRDSFVEDEEYAELAKEQYPAPHPADTIVGVPTRDLEFKTRSLVIEGSGAYSGDPEFQDLSEISRRRAQSSSAVHSVGTSTSRDDPDNASGILHRRHLSLSTQHLPAAFQLEKQLILGTEPPKRKAMRQNSDSTAGSSRGFWFDFFHKGRSLSLSHIEQAGVENPATHGAGTGLSPAVRSTSATHQGMCVSTGAPSSGDGPGFAQPAPVSPSCLDVPGPDVGVEPQHQGQQHQHQAVSPGVTTVTSFVGNSRRHRLVRSQVNSSEYFSVSFDMAGGADAGPDEFVAAARGVTLAEALQAPCNRRGVDVSGVSVTVDDARASLSADTACLAGRHIRVRVRDTLSPSRSSSKESSASGATLLKSVSEQSYDRGWSSGRSFFSVSTDDGADSEAAPSRSDRGSTKTPGSASKQRWSSLFGNTKDTKMEALVEQLKQYSESGIPRNTRTEPEDYDQCKEELERASRGDWRELVPGGGAELTERRRQQQAALWELLCTEAAYVQVIHVVTRLFLACLRSLQACGLLVEVDAGRLFCNVEAVAAASLQFWTRHLGPAVTSAKTRGLPLDPAHLREGFLKFQEIFQPYTQYCAEQLNCQSYCREMCRKDELFAAYLAWCEAQPACGRLRLADLLVKPMQRLTRYSLLLRAVLRHTDDEHQATSLARMITSVDEFVNAVNLSLKTREDNEKLKTLIARIESYDVVDAVKDEELERQVRLYSQLDLTGPMPGCHVTQQRQVLMEGDLKLREGAASKTDVRCVLLTDVLLVCKKAGRRRAAPSSSSHAGGAAALRVVRPPYLVERLRAAPTTSGLGVALVYLSEWRTAVSAFTLTSSDARAVAVWVTALHRAQDLYATARMMWSTAPQLSSPLANVPLLQLLAQTTQQEQQQQQQQQQQTPHQQPASEQPPDWPATTSSTAVASRSDAPEASLHSPRLDSSRSSRLSSLAQSHSSSLEMNDPSSLSSASQSQSREASVDINRGSSLSSDEGLLMPHSAAAGTDSRQATSPRNDRRSRLLSPTPSSLCLLQPPTFQSGLGQSLPNLTLSSSRGTDTVLASRSVTPTPRSSPAAAVPSTSGGSPVLGQSPPASLLLVPGQGHAAIRKQRHHQPQHLLSPGHRGVSYPPPSPCRGSLQRATPVPQSRNPPLVKTGHVASVGSVPPLPRFNDMEVPLIAGVSPPSDEKQSPRSSEEESRGTPHTPQQQLPSPGSGDVGSNGGTDGANGNGKRLARQDNRRYRTAGAIDDIKKQETRDTSIHKRLSWNCGRQQQQQQQNQQQREQQPGDAARGVVSGGGSQESVRSSSGVSSGGSATCLLDLRLQPEAALEGSEPVQRLVYEWRRAPSCPAQSNAPTQHQLYLSTGGHYPQGGTPPLSPRAVPLEAVNVEMVHPAAAEAYHAGIEGSRTPRAATPSPTPPEYQHQHHRHHQHQRRPPGGLQRMKDAIVMDPPIDGTNV